MIILDNLEMMEQKVAHSDAIITRLGIMGR